MTENLDSFILKNEIYKLPTSIIANYIDFENASVEFQSKYAQAYFPVSNHHDLKTVFNSQMGFFKQIEDAQLAEMDATKINISTLFKLYLILEISNKVGKSTPELHSIFEKLNNFFHWDTTNFPSLKTTLNKTYIKYCAAINMLVLFIFQFWQMNTTLFEAGRSSFPYYCLLVIAVTFIVWLYCYIKNKNIPDDEKTYPLEEIEKLFRSKISDQKI